MDNQQPQSFKDLINQSDSVPANNASAPVGNTSAKPIAGLSVEEMLDPDKVVVTITDTVTPIVVLFGAPSSGKTMALYRMIRFLTSKGYRIEAARDFRPSHDTHYTRMCDNLLLNASRNIAPKATDEISFMLVKVVDDHGTTVCQILEAPGEHYFDPENPQKPFPVYINHIINTPNRKVWAFFCEKDWGDAPDRAAYAIKIQQMQVTINNMGNVGKIIFLMNKADQFTYMFKKNGFPNESAFFTAIDQQYKGIFDSYTNTGFTAALFGARKFKAIPFSVGTFNQAADGTKIWTPGPDWYCEQFWKAIR